MINIAIGFVSGLIWAKRYSILTAIRIAYAVAKSKQAQSQQKQVVHVVAESNGSERPKKEPLTMSPMDDYLNQ